MASGSMLLVSPSRYAPQLPSSLSAADPVSAFGAHTSIGASVKLSASMSLALPSDCYHQFVLPPSIAPCLSALRARAPFSASPKVSATRGISCCSGSLPSAVALENLIGRPDGERRENRFGFPSKGRLLRLSTSQVLSQRAKDITGKYLSGDLGIGIDDFDMVSEYERVAFMPYTSAGDPNLLSTAQGLKMLHTCGSDVIELGVPYSDCLADGSVIQAAATLSFPWGCNFDAITSMSKVVPQLSSSVAWLKLGFEKCMSILKDAGFQVPRPPRVYDVFISYKRQDMLHSVSHLKHALDRRGTKAFVDFTMEGGVKVQPAIEEAIEQSEIAVVIVSENYHLSLWCLIELVKILECQRKWGLIVLPILWGMDPKDLREQPRHFVENIAQGEKGFKQEQPHQLQKYRNALRELGMIKALPVLCSSDIPEYFVTEDAADQISERVSRLVGTSFDA